MDGAAPVWKAHSEGRTAGALTPELTERCEEEVVSKSSAPAAAVHCWTHRPTKGDVIYSSAILLFTEHR